MALRQERERVGGELCWSGRHAAKSDAAGDPRLVDRCLAAANQTLTPPGRRSAPSRASRPGHRRGRIRSHAGRRVCEARRVSANPASDALLARHAPVVRYDAQEPYFADSAAEWTDNPGNELIRADGTVLAEATPTSGVEQLSLGLLRATVYPDGKTATPGDRINNPAKDYVTQARALHAEPQYRNQMYGHAATGSDGRLWLAYWFFYFYNDYNLVGDLFPAGLHEGDWEMIQLRIGPDGQTPDLAVYAQHSHRS